MLELPYGRDIPFLRIGVHKIQEIYIYNRHVIYHFIVGAQDTRQTKVYKSTNELSRKLLQYILILWAN